MNDNYNLTLNNEEIEDKAPLKIFATPYITKEKTGESEEFGSIVNSIANTNSKLVETIVIDAGHGGYDSGSIGVIGTKEKDVTLEISLKLGSILEKRGFNVLYTRKSDKVTWPSDNKLDISARADISNQANADIFISIHLNTFKDKNVTGTETYYNKLSSEGKELAQLIQDEIIKNVKSKNRGIKTEEFSILKKVEAPAILIELGYITNKGEESLLINSNYQHTLTEAIATGLNKYLTP
ncbi:putative N-acetylmuramoyl-L-alanine amidase [Clostridium intestinale URNW]|uniref:Putative N-acetylmuramoyl-L-alanine amidase n=1 Tax=Clostridium intestinale URNW TaxID=1294142 RepID=U2Q8E4_9CLOT|nr:putative N-acetylmuramoyl-L-alanine amidase [Clostridium intestinale URNW]